MPEPPGATLTAEGETRQGVGIVGCWREKQGWLPDRKVCISSEAGAVDRSGRRVEALQVGREGPMFFEYGGASAPEEVDVRVTRQGVPLDMELAGKQDRMARGREGVHNPTFGTRVETLPVERVNGGAEAKVNLASGRYLMIVAVQVDDEAASGKAFYDFNVVVQ